MENNFIASATATDLSQLIFSANPLEVLNVERNQEDNQKVLAFVNGFLDVVDAELAVPKSYKDYVLGKKDTFIRSEMVSRLELVASRIMEKKTLGCATLNLEELNFFQEELNFMVDLYHLLVTSLIDLSAIRKTDLVDQGLHEQLYDIIIEQMEFIGAYPELESLISELNARKDDYPDHPQLQAKIKELLQYSPIQDGDFIFAPPRSVSDYNAGDILIAPHPDSEIGSVTIGDLPPGVGLEQDTGRLFVQRKEDLVAGFYNVLVSTSDEIGGFTQHQLELSIGSLEIASYEVAPYRVIEDYIYGEVLARPVTVHGSMPISKARWGTEIPDIPTGVQLDTRKGTITVQDEDVLQIGIYPVEVILTYQDGTESRHEFVLSFKQDRKAVYTFQPTKLLQDYQKGDTLASVSDDDGKIIQAQKNKLPAGMRINDKGRVEVSDPSLLRPGTHRFNVLTLNHAKYQAVKTLFITLDADPNPFYYNVYDFGPTDTLKKGQTLAKFTSLTSVKASKVVLAEGIMPPGTQLATGGDVTVSEVTKLKAGNYDLSMRVFVDQDNGQLSQLQNEKTTIENNILANTESLENLRFNLEQANSEYIQYKAAQQHAIEEVNQEIAEIEEALNDAQGEEREQLLQQLAQKQAELQALMDETQQGIDQRETNIASLNADIQDLENQISDLEIALTDTNNQIATLKANRWIEYRVQLLLTLEEDNESAWHLEIPKYWDEYTDNELIAQVVDCDGHKLTEIIVGSEPPGMKLDGVEGRLNVTSRSLLVPGEYLLRTRTTDDKNGVTEHRLAIVVGGDAVQQPILYTMLPSKPANNYVENEIIGYPYLQGEQITSSRVTNGILPSGITMNPVTGELIISDPSVLHAGEYNDIISKSITANGFTQYFEIDVLILPEVTFDALVTPPKALQDYNVDDILIKVRTLGSQQGQGSSLQGIQIVGGDMVAGAALRSGVGEIYVKSASLLVAGDYSIDLLMLETNGASDQQTVQYTIGLDSTTAGRAAATGSQNVKVVMADQKDFHNLLNKDTLATLESSQTIAQVYPKNDIPGVGVNRKTGRVFVQDRNSLERQQHTITMDVDFEDPTILQEEVQVYLDFRPVPNYALDKQTLQFSLGVRDRIAEFETSGPTKTDTTSGTEMQQSEFTASTSSESMQMMNLASAQTAGGPFMKIIEWADDHVFHLANADMRKNYYLAKDDADNFKKYMAVVEPILQLFEKGIDEPAQSKLLAVYNEIFVSAVSISMYRGDDVSIRRDNPVGRMYAEMDAHLDFIGSRTDVTYLRENANFIADKMNPQFKNLIAHFAKLRT